MTLDRATIGWTGVPLVLVGVAVALAACLWLAVAELRHAREDGSATASARVPDLTRAGRWCLVLALIVGAAVRVVGLGERSLSHVESYIPGLDLPDGMSMPPPRHALVETAVWHFRSEPHPVGYYLAMWAWTRAVGATQTTIRVPAAILGVLSIWVIYRVGSLAYSTPVGVVAAALLSLHGFHTFWSQAGRMWAPGAFLGLVSTWLLLRMTRGRPPRVGIELAYVVTTVSGAATVEFFWLLLCGQILWIALQHSDDGTRIPRPAVFQALAFMLAAPLLSHAAMLGRNEAAPQPTLEFLREYFSFGFLFQPGPAILETGAQHGWLTLVSAAILGVSVALLAGGLGAGRAVRGSVADLRGVGWTPILICAGGMSFVMLGLAVITYVRHEALAALSVVPILALAIPSVAGRVRPLLARSLPSVAHLLERRPAGVGLVPLLAIVPTLVLFAVSFVITLTASRAFLIFVPYLLIVIAAGAVALSRSRLAATLIAVVLMPLFVASNASSHRQPLSPRDYQGLARQIRARLQPDDLIFVPGGHWGYTPLFFYLAHDRLVPGDFATAARLNPRSRVWLPLFSGMPTDDDTEPVLAGYQIVDHVQATGGEATLYVPAAPSGAAALAPRTR